MPRLAEFQNEGLLGLVHCVKRAEGNNPADDDDDAQDNESQICHWVALSERFLSSGSGK